MTDEIWCLTGELPRETADLLDFLIDEIAFEMNTSAPTLSYFEQPDTTQWRADIFFTGRPDRDFLKKLLDRADLSNWQHTIAKVENKDWVTESQKFLKPVHEGRFFIHGTHDADNIPPGDIIPLQIDAGQAFGTGQHETTSACLRLVEDIATSASRRRILDLGTGTGVLGLAAHRLWPQARVLATDIDPIAIDVSRENLAVNRVAERSVGQRGDGMALAVADGLDAPCFKEEGPFDLILANILAGPLVDMAGDITAALSEDGIVILSGLLVTQKKEVLNAYEARGLETLGRVEKGEWAALVLGREASSPGK